MLAMLSMMCSVFMLLASASASSDSSSCIRANRTEGGVCASAVTGNAFVQKSARTSAREGLNAEADDEYVHPSLADVTSSSSTITIVSYNLYWWNVRQNNRWDQLWSRIRGARSFDLIGFQECEDVARVLSSSGLTNFGYYLGPKPNPAPIAWNRQVFTKIGGPGNKYIASDKWGNRHLTWVRLRHNAAGVNVLFANTHGPLGNCGNQVGNNWKAGINENKRAGDIVFMTGDYNCGSGTPAMNILKGQLNVAYDGGIDQILADGARKASGGNGRLEGSPSDHPLIKGAFAISGGASTPRRRRAVAPVTLNGAAQCAGFSQWPNVASGVTCSRCIALVKTAPYNGRCDAYCQSFGHRCVEAAEEQNNNCNVKYRVGCSQSITGTSDMLCACQGSNAATSGRRRRTKPPSSASCVASNVQRRRRDSSCACRRRDGRSSTGLYECVGNTLRFS